MMRRNEHVLIPGMSALALTREERRLRRVSKDGQRTAWFETAQARLLTMRTQTSNGSKAKKGNVTNGK
jgi:hypothetical protein